MYKRHRFQSTDKKTKSRGKIRTEKGLQRTPLGSPGDQTTSAADQATLSLFADTKTLALNEFEYALESLGQTPTILRPPSA
jgi:hypothetical protein